ncbi:WecB/TagA/CpsF family glycosyltransferase [Vibrio sp. 1640]|uniref:WecB/TagA/CpsF family glycosyltransferase n=1 Tax=Vibrio sp. 1640 TaxID=3074570 RepID=UPI002964436F|nr:WecB/TagA/CpsF family glycosyltransferase [Vibrio sp. 1640]MDW2080744.1 WecB/TagA/CpsF family glycosyltransferase [Vibrio sp. 1640]
MLGVTFNAIDFLKEINSTRLVTFVNPVSFYGFFSMPERKDFTTIYSDGVLLTGLHNFFFRNNKIERISFDFSSIAEEVLATAEILDLNVIFVGGSNSDAELAKKAFNSRFSQLKLEVFSGFFDSTVTQEKFIESLNETAPDLIICGMGYPHQELFLIKCKKLMHQPFVGFTCGGFITQTAIKPDYYSPIVKRFGLRWLQRACMHSHVRKRLMKDYPLFLIRYISDSIMKGEKVYK